MVRHESMAFYGFSQHKRGASVKWQSTKARGETIWWEGHEKLYYCHKDLSLYLVAKRKKGRTWKTHDVVYMLFFPPFRNEKH
jgi:hypothetical protein